MWSSCIIGSVHPSRGKILIVVLAAAAFLPFLGKRDIVISHEARVIQTAREMSEAGWPWNAKPSLVPRVAIVRRADGALRLEPDPSAERLSVNPWLVPVLNDQIRLQKPPLPYWCCAALFKLNGGWSEGLSRLIPAILGALATLLIADMARLAIGRRAALPAALVWMSAYFIPDEFRKSMADPYLAFFSLATIWGWMKASGKSWGRAAKPEAAARDPGGVKHEDMKHEEGKGSALFLLLAYVSMALGLLAKGPPLFVHLLIPIVLFHFTLRRRLPGPWWGHLMGLALAAAIALPWPMYVLKHVPNASEMWKYESVGEMTGDNLENARPWFFYLPLLFQLSLPWTPLWIVGLILPFVRHRKRPSSFILHPSSFPLAWYVVVVIFFSCVHLKKAAYLLPAMPALALMVAQAMVALIAGARRFGPQSFAVFLLAGQSLIAVGFAIAIPFLLQSAGLPLMMGIVAAAPLALATGSLRMLNRRRPGAWMLMTASAFILSVVIFLNFNRTPLENARSPRPAAEALLKLLQNNPDSTVSSERLPAEASLYLPLTLAFDPRASTLYHLTDDPHNLAAPTRETFDAIYPGMLILSIERVDLGKSVHPRWKLFKLKVTPGRIMAGGAW